MPTTLQQRLLDHVEQLAALGEVKEHHFLQGSEAGTNLIMRLPGQHAGSISCSSAPITTSPSTQSAPTTPRGSTPR